MPVSFGTGEDPFKGTHPPPLELLVAAGMRPEHLSVRWVSGSVRRGVEWSPAPGWTATLQPAREGWIWSAGRSWSVAMPLEQAVARMVAEWDLIRGA